MAKKRVLKYGQIGLVGRIETGLKTHLKLQYVYPTQRESPGKTGKAIEKRWAEGRSKSAGWIGDCT